MKKEESRHVSGIVRLFVKEYHLEEGYRIGCVLSAWEEVLAEVTAGAYPREKVASLTSGNYLKDGVLTCRVSSSLLRMQLSMNSEMLLRRLNGKLSEEHQVTRIVIR